MIRRISRQVAESEGIEPPSPVNLPVAEPDDGFRGNPGTQQAADAAVRELRRKAQEAGLDPELLHSEKLANDKILARARELRGGEVAGQEPEVLKVQTAFQVTHGSPAPAEGTIAVDYANYSQRLGHLEELIVRAQQEGIRLEPANLAVSVRASAMRNWPPQWTDAEVAKDRELQRTLGDADAAVRQVEYQLRARFGSAKDAAAFAHWLSQRASAGEPGALAESWAVPDVRVHGLSEEELRTTGLDTWMKRVSLEAMPVRDRTVSTLSLLPSARLAAAAAERESLRLQVALPAGGRAELRLSPAAMERRAEVVIADLALVEAEFRKDPAFYVGRPGDPSAEIPGRRPDIDRAITSGATLPMPEVALRGGSLGFRDGRHRFAVLREAGVTSIPLAVDPEDVEVFRQRFETAAGAAQAIQVAGSQRSGVAIPRQLARYVR